MKLSYLMYTLCALFQNAAGFQSLAAQEIHTQRSTSTQRDARFWTADSAVIQREIQFAIEREVLMQREAWKRVEAKAHGNIRQPAGSKVDVQRIAMMHCHTDLEFVPSEGASRRPDDFDIALAGGKGVAALDRRPFPLPTIIFSKLPHIALCPNWLPNRSGSRSNSHEYADTIPTPTQLVPFSRATELLLDSAIAARPSDQWYVDQRVRVLTENARFPEAMLSIRACSVSTYWCDLLRGYVTYMSGNAIAADSHFVAAVIRMPPDARCELQSIGLLLSPVDSSSYVRLPCKNRMTIDENLMWLSTPFLSDRANTRRAEHFTRVVRSRLISQLSIDPYHDVRSETGADAIVAMRLRYGWPHHMAWLGNTEEKSHIHWMGSTSAAPFSAAEYGRLQVSLFPPLNYATNVFDVSDDDFLLGVPPNATASTWWPREFYNYPSGTIERLRSGQHVMLRRDTSALLIYATEMRGGFADSLHGRTGRAQLAYSPSPNEFSVLDSRMATKGERVVLQGAIVRPGLFGVEYVTRTNNIAGARTRLGIKNVPTLSNLDSQHCALSAPMFIDSSAVRTQGIDDVLIGLLATTNFRNPKRLGVAWESYAFEQTGSTEFKVNVVRTSEISKLRELGIKLGVMEDPSQSVTVSWREGTPSGAKLNGTNKPTVLHELFVDVSKLSGGSYVIQVSMLSASCSAASELAEFFIDR